MPESDSETLCLTLRGTVTLEDYRKNFKDRLDEIAARHGCTRLVLYYGPSFKGWSPEAAKESMDYIIDSGHFAKKLAYVNPSEKKIFHQKLMGDFFGGETRFFAAKDLQEAIAWVKAPN